ncbi:MAG: nucleotidyltransferase domain-containing protein [Holophagaceae bacterium]|nr:nucleotidyltransferase domain-containing protein [Holophagaceae bacterium]
MAIDIETIHQTAISYAKKVSQTMPVDKAVIFGSYAKGNPSRTSDVDICFFLKDYKGKKQLDILTELILLTQDYKGIYFEPLVFETSELDNNNPFVKEIIKTGKNLL